MTNADVILKFEIAKGKSPDAQIAAEALTAWVDIIRAAAAVVEPGAGIRIDLVGVEEGSQVFKLAFRRTEEAGAALLAGMEEFPLISKAAMTLGGLIASAAIVVGVTNTLTPDPRIPADQMAVFEEMNQNLRESVELQKQQMRFYGILQDEPAYESIDVIRGWDEAVVYSIPRSEFAARSGVWAADEDSITAQVEPRYATWDVVLIKPVLVPLPRRWRFAREGLEFSALMQDPRILEAIHNRTLPIQIAEGIMMKVEVQYREVYGGKAWLPVPGSHKIKRVLHPLPPVSSGPLFLDSGTP